MTESPVYSTILGNSADAMHEIARLYIPQGALVADLTHNKGTFWKRLGDCDVIGSDIERFSGVNVICDFTETPYSDETFDVVVLDPPYGCASTSPRKGPIDRSYNLGVGISQDHIRESYIVGMMEAFRVLKHRGTMIVKCQALVNGGRQHWIDNDVLLYGQGILRMVAQDRFHMLPKGRPTMRHKGKQQHARKWGSTFWVFRKPKGAKG